VHWVGTKGKPERKKLVIGRPRRKKDPTDENKKNMNKKIKKKKKLAPLGGTYPPGRGRGKNRGDKRQSTKIDVGNQVNSAGVKRVNCVA